MGEAFTFMRVLEIVPAAGVTTLLVIAVWYLVTSRVPTPREYTTLQELVELERERVVAERERAERKETEAREAHKRLDQVSAALPIMAELMESIDRRLNMHGFPEREAKQSWRWPWERERGGL